MYSAIQTFGPLFVGQLAAQGIDVELPTLPDLEAIEPHILPRIDTTRRTPEGLESESFSTVPIRLDQRRITGGRRGAGCAVVAGRASRRREAAGRNQAMNKLKQIALALQNLP